MRLFPGPIFTFRAFKQSALKTCVELQRQNFEKPWRLWRTLDWRKSVPEDPTYYKYRFCQEWPRFYHMVEWIEWVNTLFTNLSSQAEFQQRFHLPSHRHITPAIKTQLKSKGYVPSGFFTDWQDLYQIRIQLSFHLNSLVPLIVVNWKKVSSNCFTLHFNLNHIVIPVFSL